MTDAPYQFKDHKSREALRRFGERRMAEVSGGDTATYALHSSKEGLLPRLDFLSLR